MTTFLNIVVPCVFFCYFITLLLYRQQNLDILRIIAWKAFLLTVPIALCLSTITGESWHTFMKRMLASAFLLLSMQVIRPLTDKLPPPLRRPLHYLFALVDDLLAFLTFLLLHRRQCWKTSLQESIGSGSVPILLIHGYAHDAGAWCYHRPLLAQAHIGPLFTIDLGTLHSSIEDYAKRVQQKAEKIAMATGSKELILVGYSMGGIIAAYYALHFAPQHTIRKVITIGSPFNGTKLAIFGKGECAAQMRYASPFLQQLQSNMAADDQLSFCHIGTWSDTIVRPPTSTWRKGNHTHAIIFEDYGHLALLYSETINKTLYVCLLQSLAEGEEIIREG